MTQTKTVIPVALAVLAATGNYLVWSKVTTTAVLVAVRDDIKPGVPITADDLRPVKVGGDAAVFRGAVPYDKRDAVFGKTVRRRLAAGELLLRGDIEHEAFQIDSLLLAGGEKSLTLPARAAALGARPHPGAKVELHVRQGAGVPAARFGPYTFLGWVQASPTARDQDLLYLAVGVREDDARLAELRAVREANDPNRLVSVEIVRPLTLPATAATAATAITPANPR